MVRFRVINGRTVPIQGSERRRGGMVITIGVAVSLAAAGGTAGVIGGGAGASGAAPGVSASGDVSVNLRSARTSRQKSERTRLRLRLHHPDARANGDATTTDCADQATGRVREHLLAHPCRSLQRGSFSVSPVRGARVVVSVAWVEMPDAGQAAALKEILDAPGTGYVRPLDRGVRPTGQHYASRQDGEIVTTAEVEPVLGRVADAVLDGLARDASG